MEVLWALFPVATTLGLSLLPERSRIDSALARQQTWGCRAVSAVLAVVFAVNVFRLIVLSPLAQPLVRGTLWPIALVLLLSQLFYFGPVAAILLLRQRFSPQSLGLGRQHAGPFTAAAAAAYFFVVFVWSLPRYYGRLDWSDLYKNEIFGLLLVHAPITEALAIVILVVVGACVEEVIFRGVALIPLARVITPAGGIIATALFWSMAHFTSHERTFGIFVLGHLLGWMFLRTGFLFPSLTFHVLWNLGSVSDFAFGRLAQAGVRFTSEEHFLYIGLGSLGIALMATLVAVLTWPRHRAD